MTDKLKPVRCGCGGEAKVFSYDALSGEKLYYINCTKCGICTASKLIEADAITAWNRAMRRAKVDILPNTSEDKGEMPFCPHCGDGLEWE